jgi:hypothetical protein
VNTIINIRTSQKEGNLCPRCATIGFSSRTFFYLVTIRENFNINKSLFPLNNIFVNECFAALKAQL